MSQVRLTADQEYSLFDVRWRSFLMCGKLAPIRGVCFHKEVVLTTGFLRNLVVNSHE